MTTTLKTRHGGLDWNVPNDGKAADAYDVATTATFLLRHSWHQDNWLRVARHATRLHVISGLLHRLAERQCNEDLACRKCQGEGCVRREAAVPGTSNEVYFKAETCSACAGTGLTIGRKLESLRADAREIAQHYGLICYFQADPRGCSLYIGVAEEMTHERYNRGHAVVRLGR